MSYLTSAGLACCAQYSADLRWYRAEVLVPRTDDNLVGVLFVDYGNSEYVEPSRWGDTEPWAMLTHCGIVMAYADKLRSGSTLAQVMAWWHQAITWTIVDFSLVRLCGIHPRAISRQMHKLSR